MPRSTPRIRITAATAAIAAALAIAPAGASAATTWFGSSLDHTPANAGTPCNQNFNVPGAKLHPRRLVLSGLLAVTPRRRANGTIVKIRVRPRTP